MIKKGCSKQCKLPGFYERCGQIAIDIPEHDCVTADKAIVLREILDTWGMMVSPNNPADKDYYTVSKHVTNMGFVCVLTFLVLACTLIGLFSQFEAA